MPHFCIARIISDFKPELEQQKNEGNINDIEIRVYVGNILMT